MVVKNKDIIKVHYTGKFENGEIFESSLDGEPIIFQTGVEMMIPGFDKGVIGMKVGEKKEIIVPASDGYGNYDEDKIIEVSLDEFPEGHTPETGMDMELIDEDGNVMLALIKEIKDSSILLDVNHPLAGKSCIFEVKVLEIGCEMPKNDDEKHHHH